MSQKYATSGVNIPLGDECSRIAYQAAKDTFSARAGLIGAPVTDDGGFTGMMDFGDFYLVQNNDSVGSKSVVAELVGRFDTLGYDLLAMVADDAVCSGAEVVSISNTIEISKVDHEKVSTLMNGLKKACVEQKIVIPGGEIAEMGDLVGGLLWDATAIGIIEKSQVLDPSSIQARDSIIGLRSQGFRSNGFSLIRRILQDKYGQEWYHHPYDSQNSWGEIVLVPSLIYHDAILSLLGRFREQRQIEVKGIAHITGGGIPGNLSRILKKNNLGANLNHLFPPHEPMIRLQDFDTVKDSEAYQVWNMGIGMILVCDPRNTDKIINLLEKKGIKSQQVGQVTANPGIELVSKGFFESGELIKYS